LLVFLAPVLYSQGLPITQNKQSVISDNHKTCDNISANNSETKKKYNNMTENSINHVVYYDILVKRKSTMPKYDPPYVKKPMVKKYAGDKGPNHNPEEAAMESVNKILTFGSMPSYSRLSALDTRNEFQKLLLQNY
ncbi:hypothetical protein C0J52_26156, partial [Blattella germanica]